MSDRPFFYKLVGHEPVPITIQEYFAFQEAMVLGTAYHHVAFDQVGEVTVSTIFLGLATNLSGPPLVFETMILGGAHDLYQRRTATWAEAEAEHAVALRVAGLAPPTD